MNLKSIRSRRLS